MPLTASPPVPANAKKENCWSFCSLHANAPPVSLGKIFFLCNQYENVASVTGPVPIMHLHKQSPADGYDYCRQD